jgi:Gpi18-like mannosyltransferase
MQPHVRDLARIASLWIAFLIATNLIGEASIRELRVVPETRWRYEQIGSQDRWVRWDANWYLRIAEDGYRWDPTKKEETASVGFFPLYPLAIRAVEWITPFDYAGAGLWISRLCLFFSLWLMVILARMRGLDGELAFAPAIAILFFPTAYILGAVYAESLFLLLTLGTFVLTERGHHVRAALIAFLAGATRIHGLVLSAALFVHAGLEWRRSRSITAFLPALAAGLGVASYGVFTWIAFDDPLLYLHHRSAWDQEARSPVGPLFHWFGYFAPLFSGEYVPIRRFVQLLLFGGGIACAIAGARRKRWADAALFAALFAMNLVSGTLDGIERYLLFCFPLFFLLAEKRSTVLWPAALLAGALMQAFNIFRFVNYQTPPP